LREVHALRRPRHGFVAGHFDEGFELMKLELAGVFHI
jgi:hypothetical protein